MNYQALNILDPNLDLYQKFFVEASAGCGKTFSIEHAYIRYLLNLEKGWMPSDILVLTFTKEATKELKLRIKQGIETALFELEHLDQTKIPYLIEILNKGDQQIRLAQKTLADALANFDQAQIFTLHSFCYRMLNEHLFDARLNIETVFQEEGYLSLHFEQKVKDFFNFQVDSSLFCSSQIRILLQYFKQDFSLFLKNCIHQLGKEKKTLVFHTFDELYKRVEISIKVLKEKFGYSSEKIKADCFLKAPLYKGGHSQNGKIHSNLNKAIFQFSELFDFFTPRKLNAFLYSASLFFNHFSLENQKKRISFNVSLFYPELFQHLKVEFQTLIEELIHPSHILSNLVAHIQNEEDEDLQCEKMLTPNNLLLKFQNLLQDEKIAKKIANQFEAVVVDEFQDTDPVQWDILSRIFLKHRSKDHPFYLVGDPKQSIYAFRHADIYTFLEAGKKLGEKHKVVLDTNYRSHPHLVQALNDLFEKLDPNWIELPKWNQALSYLPVKSSPTYPAASIQDERKSIHFFCTEESRKRAAIPSKELEEEKLFPFIANEISRLYDQEKMDFNHFAILVRDRFQGARLKKFLKNCRIPFKATRSEELKESDTAAAFLQLYTAVLDPKNISKIQHLELNPYFLLPLDKDQIEASLSKIMAYLGVLKEKLFSQGFLQFYTQLMEHSFISGPSFYERILTLEEGLEVYLELEQIKDLLVEQEILGMGPNDLKNFLRELSEPRLSSRQPILQRQNLEKDAVNILSLHMSKGLEFEIVFALGVINRTNQKEDLIPYEQGNEVVLAPPNYCEKQSEIYFKELAAEKLRQFYVALTRAKIRLYIPALFTYAAELNKASPLELFLKKVKVEPSALISFIKKHPHMSYSTLQDRIDVSARPQKSKVELVEPKKVSIKLPTARAHSFSSLALNYSRPHLERIAPHDFDSELKTIHTLPAGAETGNLYHQIMEKIDFSKVNCDLSHFLEGTPYFPWREVIEQNIDENLSLKIKTPYATFSLKELTADKTHKEIEFLYPQEGNFKWDRGVQFGDFLQGYIDLVCWFEDKFYILDYKTNWLGDSDEEYQNLEKTMEAHHYFLQAQIYEEALKKYLNLFKDIHFETHFGGTLYLFIRGKQYYYLPPNSQLGL